MSKQIIIIILSVFTLISGCNPSTIKAVSEVGEIVGSWKSVRPGLAMVIKSDGAVLQELTLTRIKNGEYEEFNVFFEDGLAVVTGLPEYCGEAIGSYEAKILPSGNLVFSVLTDECNHRIDHFQAAGGQNGEDLEWVKFE